MVVMVVETDVCTSLPRKHFKIHKALRLPRNPRQGRQSAAGDTKLSALQDPQSAPATKTTPKGSQSPWREICTSRSMRLPRIPQKVHKALVLPRNLHLKAHITFAPRALPKTTSRCQHAAFARLHPTSENEPHVQNSRFTAPATKSEHAEDHRRVQSTAPATKSAHRQKTTPAPVTKSRL